VKNLLDATELIAPQSATVEQLLSVRPPRWFRSAPRHRLERLVVQLEIEVLAFKNEPDGDIHAIVRGGAGELMVAEFPNSICTVGSPQASAMESARQTFVRLMHQRMQRLRLTGVLLFDKVHGQAVGAPNGIESLDGVGSRGARLHFRVRGKEQGGYREARSVGLTRPSPASSRGHYRRRIVLVPVV
jgi:hypothetical protein